MNEELVLIESKEGVSIYGRKINGTPKLGNFEVHSSIDKKNNSNVYASYAEAERRRNFLLGTSSYNSKKK